MRQDIDAALERLREAIASARSMPMSASAVINRGEVLELVDRLESAVADTLSHASTVVDDRDAVLATGQAQAEEILRAAREQQEHLISDTDVYRVAQQRSEELLDRAQREAAETRAELDRYVEEHLANFELTLDKTLREVQRGRARLTEGHASGLADDTDVPGISLPDHLRRD